MKEIFVNNDNLKDEEIEEEATRVKGLLINDNDEILLGYSYSCYQFPGGHMEGDEDILEVLKREVKEEAGMDIEVSNAKPFLLSRFYIKNYTKTGKNRHNKIYYVLVRTNEKPNVENTNYTKEELIGNYALRYVKMDKIIDTLLENCKLHPVSKDITNEMLLALDCYFKQEEKK